MRSIDQLPPPDRKDIPETPYSHTWERAFEPEWRPTDNAHKREYMPQRVYVGTSPRMPETEMQALMEAKPHCEPEKSKQESAVLKDRISAAVDSLEPRLKWIFEARHYRGLSVREIGRELSLSKSYVDRLYTQATKELQQVLADLVEP